MAFSVDITPIKKESITFLVGKDISELKYLKDQILLYLSDGSIYTILAEEGTLNVDLAGSLSHKTKVFYNDLQGWDYKDDKAFKIDRVSHIDVYRRFINLDNSYRVELSLVLIEENGDTMEIKQIYYVTDENTAHGMDLNLVKLDVSFSQ